jgi:hypothetical protein
MHKGAGFSAATLGNGKIFTVQGHTLRRHNIGTGTLDTGFDGDGRFDLESQTVLEKCEAFDVAVSGSNGKIAVTGTGQSLDPTERTFPQRVGGAQAAGSVIVLLNFSGTLDNTFDSNASRSTTARTSARCCSAERRAFRGHASSGLLIRIFLRLV